MMTSALQYRITDIFAQIQTAKTANEMCQVLQYRLLPLIQGERMLAQEWERRVCYYRILSKETSYINLIDDIHDLLKKISKKIDPTKLSNKMEDRWNNNFRYKDKVTQEKPDWLSAREMHSLMTSRKDWFSLNEGEAGLAPFQTSIIPHQGIDDSFTAPWKYGLKQYKIWGSFLRYAVDKCNALNIDDPEVKQWILALFTKTQELETILERPSAEQCLPDFEWINWYAVEGYTSDSSLPQIKERAVRIQKELEYFFLQHQEEKKEGKKEKRIVRSVKNGIITTVKGDEYTFKKKNSNSALLCEKAYSYCRKIDDRVEIQTIYTEVWKGNYNSDPIGNRKKVSDAVDNVNELAKKKELPKLLHCTKSYIERLA